MYVPAAFENDDEDQILEFVREVAFGHLVTSDLNSTPLPFLIDDEATTLRAHFARANSHWRSIDEADALMIVPGVDTYISPRWYPSKAEHGKVVPTWNYEVVHIRGTIEVHDDPEWLRAMVTDLTDHHESRRSAQDGAEPWAVTDAPPSFIDGQLKAVVGVQLNVTSIEAKRKMSQNRAEQDRLGVIQGLRDSPSAQDQASSDLVERL